MSVLPVSDALRQLEADGLVETRARAGHTRAGADRRRTSATSTSCAKRSNRSRRGCSPRAPLPRSGERCSTARPSRSTALFNRLATKGDDPAFRFNVHTAATCGCI